MYMKRIYLYICLLSGLSFAASCSDDKAEPELPDTPALPDPEPTPEPTPIAGCPLWEAYVKAQQSEQESTLPDFSYAGYECGERGVPQVDYPVFRVDDYGAVPNDGKSDREAFEAAIAAATAFGSPAIIRFSAGRYDLRPKEAANQSIVIAADNIVLQGAGSGEGGTELFMEYPNLMAQEGSLWSGPELIRFTYTGARPDAEVKLTDITGNARRGGHTLQVASTSGLYMGQWVLLKVQNNDPEFVAQEVSPYPIEAEWSELPQQGVMVSEYHQILRIEGKSVTFKEPLMHAVDARWGWTLHQHQYHVGCGIEDIAFRGNFQDAYVHHDPSGIHDSGYRMIGFHRQVNGWIRRCRFTDVIEAASIMLSAHVSAYQCRIEGHKGHTAIRSEASSHIFIGQIADEAGQEHSMGVSKTASGTVLWRNSTAPTSTFEAHSSQPRATLIDACSGGFLPNHAGGDASAGPNHLADLVLWNYRETGTSSGEFNLWVRNNRFLRPIIAGFQGATTFQPAQVTADESHGQAVEPASLYEAQLQTRLGYLPEWVTTLKVTNP